MRTHLHLLTHPWRPIRSLIQMHWLKLIRLPIQVRSLTRGLPSHPTDALAEADSLLILRHPVEADSLALTEALVEADRRTKLKQMHS